MLVSIKGSCSIVMNSCADPQVICVLRVQIVVMHNNMWIKIISNCIQVAMVCTVLQLNALCILVYTNSG